MKSVSYLTLMFFVGLFFINVNNPVHTGGDFAYNKEILDNALTGKAGRTYVYRNPGMGVKPDERREWAPQWSVHVNVIPYFLAVPYALYPSNATIYLLWFLWVYGGILYYSRKLDPEQWQLSVAILAASSFLLIVQYKCHMHILAAPVILACAWYAKAGDMRSFVAAMATLCLISEDSAMAGVTLSLALAFTNWRFARVGFGISVTWTLLCLFALQPWVRSGMVMEHASHSAFVLGKSMDVKTVVETFLIQAKPYFFFLPAVCLAAPSLEWIVIMPLSAFFITIVGQSAGHHTVPMFMGAYLSLLLNRKTEPGKLAFVLYLSANAFLLARHYWKMGYVS